MLLHDMGGGRADNRSEFQGSCRDWRTPPLWGIGLTEAVGGHTQFLHDGRARNLLEAVLWHGGEAQAAQRQVLAFDIEQRAALRSEEHTSEIQSLMRISYAVFCLKKKKSYRARKKKTNILHESMT